MMVYRRGPCGLSSSTRSSTDSETMAVRAIRQQLLTPATSQSEASSNTDITSYVEKEEIRHTTRRVTRSSQCLTSKEVSDTSERSAQRYSRRSESDFKTRTVSDKTLVGAGERGTSRPAPPSQSVAMTESDREALAAQDCSQQGGGRNALDLNPIARPHAELGTSPRQQTLRER